MKKILLFLTIATISCSSPDCIELPPGNRELRYSEISNPEELGPDYQIIQFTDLHGQKIWISLAKPEKDIRELDGPDEIILHEQSVTVIIDYPLDKPVEFDMITLAGGFTKKDIISEVVNKYVQIYREEEQTAKNKTIPAEERRHVANRNKTDGKYGIYGHDLSDLGLSGFQVFRKENGRVVLFLMVDS